MQFLPQRPLVRVCLLAVFLSGFVALAQQMTVATLTAFIKSSIQLKNPDQDVAKALANMKLTEKFTLADLQELQNAGVGPKTLSALARLVTQSAGLAPPAKLVAAAKPTGRPEPMDAEKNQVLRDTREWALNYVKSLPDFVCLEDTQRSVDRHFQPGAEASWTLEDRIIERLTFFDHAEKYELSQHNDTPVFNKTADSLGGARSTGEWASLLGEIFEPSTHTGFQWLRWGNVRDHLTYVYQYAVEKQYSRYTISHGDKEKIIAGFNGQVFVEKGTNAVLRVTVTANIPPDFPVQDVDQMVDYDYRDIGTVRTLLPSNSVVDSRDGHIASKNEIRWRNYQKYSAGVTLSFDEPDDQKKDDPPAKK